MILRSILKGALGAGALLVIYFFVLTLISGWNFAQSQFSVFWYFIVSLALGFGIQVGLYSYLKGAIHQNAPKSVVAVSGTTSTAAMISCCAHYLTNILPVIGAAGIISILSQYQIQLFWIGLGFNLAGIAYIGNKVIKFLK